MLSAKASERFWSKVEKTDGCWLWTKSTTDGYGQFWLNGTMVVAHKLAYTILVGPVPAGLTLDHTCRVRHCVRPSHLEPVTNRVNILRSPLTPPGIAIRKTHCYRGHPFSSDNTHITPQGHRRCRTCMRENSYASFLKRKS